MQTQPLSPLRAKSYQQDIEAVAIDKLPFMWSFSTMEGEGPFTGRPQVLCRIGGCAVGCAWCDSRYTWNVKGPDVSLVSPADVAKDVMEKAGDLKWVSITGGEPLHYLDQTVELARILQSRKYRVHLETSGLYCRASVRGVFDSIGLDIKTPSSGLVLSETNLIILRDWAFDRNVFLKAVIQDRADLEWLESSIPRLLHGASTIPYPITLTPCAPGDDYGNDHTGKVVAMILDWNRGYNIRVGLQVHKYVAVDPSYDGNG